MTGFGVARRALKGLVIDVEARTVNHRFLQVKARLPGDLASLESDLEAAVRDRLRRGAVSLTVQVSRRSDDAPAAAINLQHARAVAAGLRKLARELKLPGEIRLQDVASAPGVLGAQADSLAGEPAVREATVAAAGEAIDRVTGMREREGAALAAELRGHVGAMRESVDRIERRAPTFVAEYRDRLRGRLEDLLAGTRATVREEDLAREIALLAERSDVAEETARLRTHFDEAAQLLARREPVGRRLEFLVQEMLREINTIGSKCYDPEVTREVIDLKTSVERVREQVANLE